MKFTEHNGELPDWKYFTFPGILEVECPLCKDPKGIIHDFEGTHIEYVKSGIQQWGGECESCGIESVFDINLSWDFTVNVEIVKDSFKQY